MKNILIVEDEFINAQFIQGVLTTLGHNIVAVVTNANDALETVKSNKIDIIFMDINIDGVKDGISCANMINAIESIPIIYMSAYSDSATIEEASYSNIYGYLVKPFDDKDIEASLNVAIARSTRHKIEKISPKIINIIELDNKYTYNIQDKALFLQDKQITLTNKESSLIHLLMVNLNKNVSNDVIIKNIWNDKEIAKSTLRDTVSRLRKKLPDLEIKNISGIGYCLYQ